MSVPPVAEHSLQAPTESERTSGPDFLDLALALARNLRLLICLPLLAGLVALGTSYMITPTFSARAVILPPQQQQNATSMALQSLGSLAGAAGAATGIKSPADQYVALMQSRNAEDRLIDDFKLVEVYGVEMRFDARKRLRNNTSIQAGKKDGLISIEVEDVDPRRAAAIANAYVTQLSRLTNELAVTEAQQRRKFFEAQLRQTTEHFSLARRALQSAGINEGVIRAEPRVAADTYAKLRAEITATEIRLQSASQSLADSAPEIRRLRSELQTLNAMANKTEANSNSAGSGEYIDRYKEFKYQETLLDLFARQYEMARVDESREGALVQVVDMAVPPERKVKPMKALIAASTAVVTAIICMLWVLGRETYFSSSQGGRDGHKREALRIALRRAVGRRI